MYDVSHCPHVDKLEHFPTPTLCLCVVSGSWSQRGSRMIRTWAGYGSPSIRGISVREEMLIMGPPKAPATICSPELYQNTSDA